MISPYIFFIRSFINMIFTFRAVLACYLFLCGATNVLSFPLTLRQNAISDIDILQFALTVSLEGFQTNIPRTGSDKNSLNISRIHSTNRPCPNSQKLILSLPALTKLSSRTWISSPTTKSSTLSSWRQPLHKLAQPPWPVVSITFL